MALHDRQQVIEANRSLRLIKNELESLLEKGLIADDAFDTIHNLLPTESSLSLSRSAVASPAPAAANAPNSVPSPPVNALANVHLRSTNAHSPAPDVSHSPANPPPAYQAPPGPPPSHAAAAGGPPSLPTRNNPPPPPPPQAKPVLSHARALYAYNASDARDLSFERGDQIAVHEHMNDDWWMGQCVRTGHEGIFPRNYVEVVAPPPQHQQPPHQMGYPNEKAGWNAPAQPQYAGYPPPPGKQDPYSNPVPPMAISDGSSGQVQQTGDPNQPNKGQEYGKKFGKKLGNAAVFGAGATIGSNLVNSIF